MRSLRSLFVLLTLGIATIGCVIDDDADGPSARRDDSGGDAVGGSGADVMEDAPLDDGGGDTAGEVTEPEDTAVSPDATGEDDGGDATADAVVDTASDAPAADVTPDAGIDTAEDVAVEDGADDGSPGPCIGATEIVGVDAPTAGEPVADPTVPGSTHPNWRLTDFQPQSCGFGQTYGLDAFRGRTLVVVLLSAGCSYCLGQTVKLEQMRYQLDVEGHAVHFAIINLASMSDLQANLIERGSFPLFQDVDEVDAWGLHEGRKDDFYIYDSDGVLQTFLAASGEVSTNLSTDEGYANVHDAIVAVVEGR